MSTSLNWLTGTYWYVPKAFLPAMQFDLETAEASLVIDQTVWYFSEYRDGYLWGNCYAMIASKENGAQYTPVRYIIGSITPWNSVQFSFIPEGSTAISPMAVTGFGQMVKIGTKYVFKMQMNSGIGTVTAHWAEMHQTKEGDAAWEELPGTQGESMEEFLAHFEAAFPETNESQ
jgi:hypothetical protein